MGRPSSWVQFPAYHMAYKNKEDELKNKKEYYIIHKNDIKIKRNKRYILNRDSEIRSSVERNKNNKAQHKKRISIYRLKLWNLVLDHYGRKCNCCGEEVTLLLTVDHVNNDGSFDKNNRSGTSLYRKVIKENYPDKYQILCFNCNMGKNRNKGICPHKMIK